MKKFIILCLFISFTFSSCLKKTNNKLNNFPSEVHLNKVKKESSFINYYGLKVRTCNLPDDYVAQINGTYISRKEYEKALKKVIEKFSFSKDTIPTITKLDTIFSIFYKILLSKDMNNFFKAPKNSLILSAVLAGNFSSFNYTLSDIQTKNVCLKLNDNALNILKKDIKEYKKLANCITKVCKAKKQKLLSEIKNTIYFYEKILKPLHLPEIIYYNWILENYEKLSKITNQNIYITNLTYKGNYIFVDNKNNKTLNIHHLNEFCLAHDLYINGSLIAQKGTPLVLILSSLPKGYSIKAAYIKFNNNTLEMFCQSYLDNNYQKLLFDLLKQSKYCVDYRKL